MGVELIKHLMSKNVRRRFDGYIVNRKQRRRLGGREANQ
jgi:hypothetical protein